jgi:hypothetical protein
MDVIPSQFQVNPAQKCGFCLEEFGCDYELVAAISGRLYPMKKDPGHSYFLPDWKNDNHITREEAVIEFFHLHCFLTQVGNRRDVWKPNGGRWECGLCPEDFHVHPYAFQFQIGKVDFETWIFDPYDDQANLGLLCADCVSFHFGDGNYDAGREMLGIAR